MLERKEFFDHSLKWDTLLALLINSKGLLLASLLLTNVEFVSVHLCMCVYVCSSRKVKVSVLEILTLLQSFVTHIIYSYAH